MSSPVPSPARLLVLAVILFTLCVPAASVLGAPVEFHVAPDGSASNSGSRLRPFANVEQARDAIRKRKSKGPLPKGGATIWIHGGTYVRHHTLDLNASDSGTESAPIRYEATGLRPVRFIGGATIRRWRPASTGSGELYQRLPGAAREHVRMADLREAGITNLGTFRSRGFGRPTVPAHLELFCDAEPMTPARWPNLGESEKIDGFPEASGQGDDHGGKIGRLEGGFQYAGDRPRQWRSLDDVWVHGYWAWDWANSYERVASLDLDRRRVVTAPPQGLYGFRRGQRFHFLNVLEELDQPGEYYVDKASATLYYWPPTTKGRAETLVSVLEEPMITMAGVSHVTIRGLVIECTRGQGAVLRGGASNRLDRCTFRMIGSQGVSIEGGAGHAVTGCNVEDTGDGGVSMSGGDRQTLVPGGHVVEDCRFRRQGRWSKCYVPAVLADGVGHRISHNLIEDHPHCAILFTGNDHQIEYNEIHHVALETGDVGAIYTGRDWTYRGNRIRYNFIHDVGGVGMGSMGIYMDDCVSGTEIYGNILCRLTRAVFLGGGRDHQVVNNIFIDCKPAVQLDGRGLDKSPVWHNMVADYMRKQLMAVPKDLYRSRYPALAGLDRYDPPVHGVPPEGNRVVRNVSVGGEWLKIGWHATKSMIELENNHVDADPGFVDPARMNYQLRPDSTVWKTGFHRIPVERIGVRADRAARRP